MRPASDPDIEALLVDPGFADQQHRTFRAIRQYSPIYWSESQQQWLVTSFDLVDQVLTDPIHFSSVGAEARHLAKLAPEACAAAPTLCSHFAETQLNISDPPDHTRLRRAFNRPFLPRQMEAVEGPIASLAGELVTAALDRGDGFDVMRDLAGPLPVLVIADFMGISRDLLDELTSVTIAQRYFFGTAMPTADLAVEFDEVLQVWHSVLRATMDERRRTPADDVMTLAAGLVDDAKLSESEAIATCLHLLIAGNSTTTSLIGNVLHLLLSHPTQLAIVQGDPAMVEHAVEEALRFEPPLPIDRRIASAPTSVGGVSIAQGDRVGAVLAAACRDPEQFDRPDDFDVTRMMTVRQQAAFGRGIHLCIGAPLARLEAAIAVRTVLAQIPEPALLDGWTPRWHDVNTHRSLTTLPLSATGARHHSRR